MVENHLNGCFAPADAARPNRYVVACRPEAYRGQAALSQFQEVTIEPLETDQVSDFIRRWYKEVLRTGDAPTPEAEHKADELARSLAQAIQDKPQVRDLTDTPLLLTLVAMLHYRAQLPDSRVQLYDDCTRLLLDKWERSKPGEQGRQMHRDLTPPEVPPTVDERRNFLQPAALWLLQTGLPDAPRADWAKEIVERLKLPGEPDEARRRLEIFLEWAKDRCNILEEVEEGRFRFAHHRTFQEYLAARYLVSLEASGVDTALTLITNRDWWETLRLMVGTTPNLVRRSDFLCRALDRPEAEGPLLTGACLVELGAEYLDPALLEQTRQRLLKIMTDPEANAKDSRALAGQFLGRLGDPRPDASAPTPAFVPVPANTFWLGSHDDNSEAYSDERPRCQVTLPGFWIARYPVTNAQYERFLQDKGYTTQKFWTPEGWEWLLGNHKPDLTYLKDTETRKRGRQWIESRTVAERQQPYFWKSNRWNIPNHPVVGVTWFEAMAYCAWLNEKIQMEDWRDEQVKNTLSSRQLRQLVARLPTEAEWEAAARGAAGNEWPWGNTFDNRLSNTTESEIERTTAVGQYPAGASPYGAMDMAGNVWEWCHSLHKDYPYRADDGRENISSGGPRVVRGGAWGDLQRRTRSACRLRLVPDFYIYYVGFRVVLSPNRF